MTDLTLLSNEELIAFRDNEKHLAKIKDVEQMAKKVLINSLYGALGNEFFRFYDLRNAEAVTAYGKLAIKWVERDINIWMNKVCKTHDVDYVIYIDTDSVYVNFDSLLTKLKINDIEDTNEWADAFDKVTRMVENKVINPSYDNLHEYMNTYERQMFMDREVLARTGFWTAKKRYALDVQDNEGVRKPKLKIMGIETQRSSTPPLCQKGLKEAIRLILQEGEAALQDYVKDFKETFFAADYRDISFVSSANNLAKYSDDDYNPLKGCPGHVKAALAYNKLAAKYGFDMINEGDKIAVVFLSRNKEQIEQIAYPSGGKLPTELEHLTKSIDYHLLYQDKFMKPLENITDAIQFNHTKTISLENFFG